jgi:cystine transport system substrate-binding protein
VKKIVLILMLGALVLSFAGIIDQIKDRGYIICGTAATFPPFGYYDQSNQLVGFNVDMAKEISE